MLNIINFNVIDLDGMHHPDVEAEIQTLSMIRRIQNNAQLGKSNWLLTMNEL